MMFGRRGMVALSAETAVLFGLTAAICTAASGATPPAMRTTRAHKHWPGTPLTSAIGFRVLPSGHGRAPAGRSRASASNRSHHDVSVDVRSRGRHTSWHGGLAVPGGLGPLPRSGERGRGRGVPRSRHGVPRGPAPRPVPRRHAADSAFHGKLPFTGQNMLLALAAGGAVAAGAVLLMLSRIRRKRRLSGRSA